MGGLALLICAITLSACESASPNIGVTVGDVEQDPEQYFGQTVTVSGEINDVYGLNTFTIGGEGFAGSLLIVVPDDAQITGVDVIDTPDMDDAIVQVTGTVREYVIAEIENEFGIDLVPEIEYEEMEPAVVADAIWVTPRTGVVGEPITDVLIVVEAVDPLELAGRPVVFESVMVQEVISDNAFWIGPSEDQRLFVVLDEVPTTETEVEGRYDINAGQMISLSGTLVELPLSDDLMAALNLDDETLSMLEGGALYLLAQEAAGVPESAPGASQ